MLTPALKLALAVTLSLASFSLSAADAKRQLDFTKLPPPATGTIDFAKDIQPIFANHCYKCHGAEKQKGGLRLDRKAEALEGGDDGKVISVGNGAGSVLVQLVGGLDADKPMPPRTDSNEPLSRDQVAKIRAWIDAGAVWPETANAAGNATHWAFKPPIRAKPPRVQNSKWVRNPIDNFVLARLEPAKIKPSPEADRVTLIRRLSFDLLGLPPKADDVTAFLNDTTPDAYERLVERLLASPHFGERWGRQWLDLARYADSDGYEKDTARPYAYLFRDWVIDAINQDLPFDQFTIEQLAGDLLPNATKKQMIATGFHRQTLTNKEGGVDQEEFRCKATVDRANTTGATWLGLTVGCCECHSHKYDPLSQREYYSFYAFFNNTSERDLSAPTPSELEKYLPLKSEWKANVAKLKEAMAAYAQSTLLRQQMVWENSVTLPKEKWTPLTLTKLSTESGFTLKSDPDRTVQVSPKAKTKGKVRGTDVYTIEVETPTNDITGFRLEVFPDGTRKNVGLGISGNFVLSEFGVKLLEKGATNAKSLDLSSATADYWQGSSPANAAIDGNPKTGWSVSPQTNKAHVAVFDLADALHPPPGAKLIFQISHQVPENSLARFRLSATASPLPHVASLIPDDIAVALAVPRERRTQQQRAAIAKFYASEVDEGSRRLNVQMEALLAKEPKEPATKAAILAADPRTTQVHIRGDFLRKGEEVRPATFAVLNPLKPRSETPDRLDLARWLVDPANPLTARVTVNHIWKNLFGRALVSTVNDFGTRGDKPTHPELLDWLATEFPRLDWSRKQLITLIVSSATYKQSSVARPDLNEHDPNNQLLARQNRFRLEAENVRDAYLAASGLLVPTIGGPSVRPQLPADIAALGYANSVKWTESKGADKYRRGLYIFFQRTVPYPMLMTFDAPDSNVTCTRRERSNTPLQALTLLNDPVFFECAQSLGRQVANEIAPIEIKIAKAFQICLSRTPSRKEATRLKNFYDTQMALLQTTPGNAEKILGDPKSDRAGRVNADEKAALVMLSRVIMNLDEFVTRD